MGIERQSGIQNEFHTAGLSLLHGLSCGAFGEIYKFCLLNTGFLQGDVIYHVRGGYFGNEDFTRINMCT